MNSMRNEKYIDMVIELIDDFDDVNFIVSNEVAFEAVERLELEGVRFNEVEPISFSEFKEMFNSDKLIISKCTFEDDVEYWFESAYGNKGIKDIGCEESVTFVEEGVLTEEQIKRYIEGEAVIVIEGRQIKNSVPKHWHSIREKDSCICKDQSRIKVHYYNYNDIYNQIKEEINNNGYISSELFESVFNTGDKEFIALLSDIRNFK